MNSIGSKITRLITKHPSLVTFGIVAGFTLAIGAAIGMLDHQQVLAFGGWGRFAGHHP